MSAGNIWLLLISGLGIFHGLFFAVFLWIYPKGKKISNRLLSLLLIALTFRVGKSVFLTFDEHLEAQFIFTGLATLMIIGPLFYFYAQSIINDNFKWNSSKLIHIIPAFVGIIFGLMIKEHWLTTLPIAFFAVLFLTYYTHLLIYLISTFRKVRVAKKAGLSHEAYSFLRLMFFGFLAIWVAYVLNLFDESIPYIIGPILYSVVVYLLSFIVIKNGYIWRLHDKKYKTTSIPDDQIEAIYTKVIELVVDQKQYKDPELSLKALSQQLNTTPQILSMVINKKAEMNFNNFLNQWRIKEAKYLMEDEKYDHLTLSAIAYDAGFNSISSFNTGFKKFTGITPSAYKKGLGK